MNYNPNADDLIVCGVSDDVVLADISTTVPKGLAVKISGPVSQKSKELWIALSQRRLFKCDISNVISGMPTSVEEQGLVVDNKTLETENQRLETEVQTLKEANTSLETEVGRLQGELARVRLELSEERAKVVTFEGIGAQLGKLDEVLGLLQQKVESPALRSGFVMLPSTKTEEAAPYYIPTPTLPSEVIGQPIASEGQSNSGSSVSVASKALKERKRNGNQ